MKKTLLWLVALAMASAMALVGLAGSSSATTYITKKDCTGNGFVCMTVTFWKDTSTQGIGVYNVVGNCDNSGAGSPAFGWDSPAVDGHSLTAVNDSTGSTFFSLGEGTNVYDTGGTCQNSWYVGIDRPNSHSVTVTWKFTEQLNLLLDEDHTLSVTQLNN
jgi:hypothetical protein